MNAVNETFIKQEYLFYVTNYAKNKITYHCLLVYGYLTFSYKITLHSKNTI